MTDTLMRMLRDWQDYCFKRPYQQQEAEAFKRAADEIERLRAELASYLKDESELEQLWNNSSPVNPKEYDGS